MATYSAQSDLVVETVRDNKDLAADAYADAKRAFEDLVSIIKDLPATVVDPNIGTNATTPWTSVITPQEIEFDTNAIDATIEALTAVFQGTMLLPDPYWENLWATASADVAKQQVAALRNARNRGAASFWQLPNETVLAASRKVQDDTLKTLQMGRFQQATQQAVMAREDYWRAIQSVVESTVKKIAAKADARKMFLSENLGLLEIEKAENAVVMQKATLDQSAQETEVKLTMTQAQWLAGLISQLKKAAAELSFGYAQAAIAGTHVGLTAGTDIGVKQSITASQNEEKKWNFDMA